MIISLSYHNSKLISRIVQLLLDNRCIGNSSIQASDTNILCKDSIQLQYSKFDIDSMVEFAHKQINATSSRREKQKYRQAVLDDI